MFPTKSFAAYSATEKLKPFEFNRRDLQAEDVLIKILFCGVCHSDIHTVRSEWGPVSYPLAPGHEIVGEVVKVGSAVKNYKAGDQVGVGCFVDSCRTCSYCQQGLQQYCDSGMTGTYGSKDRYGQITQGGYSNQIVVAESYLLKIPKGMDLAATAPLLCAGITTYSPLKHWKVKAGQKVAIMGLGGLGHMGVKFAKAFGAEVTVLSTSSNKEADAKRLGATYFVNTKDPGALAKVKGKFDFILNTISANHDVSAYMNLLAANGTMVLVGLPEEEAKVHAFTLVPKRRSLAGSLIGGIPETQEMLNFCAEKGITSDIELIPIQKINEAYDRTVKADVKYRFVIDMSSLEKAP